MNRLLLICSLMPAISVSAFSSLSAQTIRTYCVEVSAEESVSPPGIRFSWPAEPLSTGYNVYRKTKSAVVWGTAIATLSGTDTSWTDASYLTGEDWEYRFQRTFTGGTGNGYIYAGLQVPATESRGTMILLVDSTFASALAFELNQLHLDLIGDGWRVIRHDVSPSAKDTAVKSLLAADYAADPANVKAVFIIGHVAVPYSGNIYPDGHPDHQGAWPADTYYGDIDGGFSDWTVNITVATRPENINIPGDGKWDQSTIPTNVDLQVGRVDFDDMPAFVLSEEELLRQYLNKDHAFRHKFFTATERAVTDDNFGIFSGEIFAANGFRNFAPLVGAQNSIAGDFRTELLGTDHPLWGYGCGGGTYTSAAGVGTSTDFAADSLLGVFTMLFGSYHGDWDAQNNFMRAALASKGSVLTCAWAGRPHWQFHHMGLGDPIGYSAQRSINNGSTYFASFFSRTVHIALHGDPSLRMHIIAPPSNLVVTAVDSDRNNLLKWSPSPETVLGYYVYRATTINDEFIRVTPDIITGTAWTDSCMAAGTYAYMVRAVNLQESKSGTYYNLSQGIFGEVINGAVYELTTLATADTLYCAGDSIFLPFDATALFCAGNHFWFELSDSTGSFTSPDTLGYLTAEGDGAIGGIVPPGITPASGYRVRVVADKPAYTGNDNGFDLTFGISPTAGFTFVTLGDSIVFTSTSVFADSFFWNFGDGTSSTLPNPAHDYDSTRAYTTTLIVMNACGSDTFFQTLNIIHSDDAQSGNPDVKASPVPFADKLMVEWIPETSGMVILELTDLSGKVIRREKVNAVSGNLLQITLDTQTLASGTYLLGLSSGSNKKALRVVKQ